MTKLDFFRLLFQVIVAIISLFYLIKNRNKFLFLLTVFLFFTAIIESIGAYLVLKEKSSFINSFIFIVLQFYIFSLMYSGLIKNKRLIKLFFILPFLYSVFAIVVYFNRDLLTYFIILGGVFISYYLFLYLKELLLSNKILNYKKLLPFWVTVGFLVFYLPSIPFFSMIKYMKGRGLFFVLNILIILMNLFIIYGLICSKKEEKY